MEETVMLLGLVVGHGNPESFSSRASKLSAKNNSVFQSQSYVQLCFMFIGVLGSATSLTPAKKDDWG